MKWIFGTVLVLALVMGYILIDNDSVTQQAWAALDRSEGAYPSDSMDKEKVVSLGDAAAGAAFTDKYQPYLQKRLLVIRFGMFMFNDDLVEKLCDKALERYKYSVLDKREEYANFLYYKAMAVEDDTLKTTMAIPIYHQFLDQYPDHPMASDVKRRLAHLELMGR